jgi:hypothetical protein
MPTTLTKQSISARLDLGLLVPGLALLACFVGMALVGDLRQFTISFLVLNALAFAFYGWVVWRLRGPGHHRPALAPILVFALAFRIALLFATPPTLSDDVYRYVWDGRIANAGISPYALAVDSPRLDAYDSSLRALVNNSWMASPYLPAAQALFAAVYRLAPDSPLAFQLVAMALDMLTGALVLALLGRLGLPRARALIYLWNPLVIVEFAHGAHIDALMICLMMVSLWALVGARSRTGSVLALAAATLTKGLPALLLPVFVQRWGWRRVALYVALILGVCMPFAFAAGWGLLGPLDGRGLFGPLRIYAAYWNYNGGLYHWLEVMITGYSTPGAVPIDAVGWGPVRAAKLISLGLLLLSLAAIWWRSRCGEGDRTFVRWTAAPLTAYLLLSTTVHPWYVCLVLPLLPFLPAGGGERTPGGRFLVPGLYASAIVSFSYLTYLDPVNLREFELVRLVEYLPLYLMLIWAAWPAISGVGRSGTDSSRPHS